LFDSLFKGQANEEASRRRYGKPGFLEHASRKILGEAY